MKTLLLIAVVGLIGLLPDSATSQENGAASSLTVAKSISAASGRPIFAIAGRKT